MRRTRGVWLVAAVVLVVGVALGGLAAGSAQAKSIVVLPRPGQVGVSGSCLYGTLLGAGSVGDQFGSGPGMAVRMRYRMRYERGFGLTFETRGLDVRDGARFKDPLGVSDATADTLLHPASPYAPRKLDLSLYGVDFYQMFGTRTKTIRMLSAGAGIAHPVRTLNDGHSDFPFGDGAYLSAGAGVERFFWQSLAFDIGARYQAVFVDGSVNHDLQLSAGFILYASL
jgi:hypothetical protein